LNLDGATEKEYHTLFFRTLKQIWMGGLPEAEGYGGSREEIQTPMVSQKAVVAVGADVADIAVGVDSLNRGFLVRAVERARTGEF
jgi:hypothetical protein